MSWKLSYVDEAKKELASFDKGVSEQITKGIAKVAQNPLSRNEGGYGEPLGNKYNINLTGLLKIKFKKIGQRVIYALERRGNEMNVLVISARADNEVYTEALKRRQKYGL